MKGQLLCFLILFVLLQSTYGILCYSCMTKVHAGNETFTESNIIHQRNKTTGGMDPLSHSTIPPQPAGSDTVKGAPAESEHKKEQMVAQCILGDKDVEENWEEKDCHHTSRACFVLKGEIIETTDYSYTRYKITERGCFFKTDNRFKAITFEKDERKTEDFTTGGGTMTATAQLTVCDEVNKGQMLCNRGFATMVMGKTFSYTVIVSVLLFHFGPLRMH